MSKVVEIVLTKTVKIGGGYRYPGDVVEVAEEQAKEIVEAGFAREQGTLGKPGGQKAPAKASKGKKAPDLSNDDASGNTPEGDAARYTEPANAES